ncbi:hypothetical protein CEXT_625951 [Caerostris extrusa]|uniref:Uncharacterized protein n=1 Tax=Caerostris extrusa TaxID=172846 RepID=A0AAV4WW26_CAEEX|nr:hypothetical protein CEXT_625951 [Caerostris extrusa]
MQKRRLKKTFRIFSVPLAFIFNSCGPKIYHRYRASSSPSIRAPPPSPILFFLPFLSNPSAKFSQWMLKEEKETIRERKFFENELHPVVLGESFNDETFAMMCGAPFTNNHRNSYLGWGGVCCPRWGWGLALAADIVWQSCSWGSHLLRLQQYPFRPALRSECNILCGSMLIVDSSS